MNPISLFTALSILAPSTVVLAETIEETKFFTVQLSSVTDVSIGAVSSSSGIIGDMTDKIYSGDFRADFTFDRDTLEVESFKFTGVGEMATDPYGLGFIGFINYPPSRSTTVQRLPQPTLASQIKFVPETRDGFEGLVNPDGTLDNLNYRIKAYSGGYSFTWAIKGSPQNPLLVNYSEFSPSFLLLKGVSTPTIEVISSTIYERTLRASLTIELDESEIVTLSGAGIASPDLDVFETEVGTVTGRTGRFKVITGYGDWSNENSPIPLHPEDTNDAGIAYGILYALDLPADTAALPISITNSPTGPVTTIILPEGGLRNPMSVEYSADLLHSKWSDLPDEDYVDGTASLDYGATGEPNFTFPDGLLGFMRFTTFIR